VAVVVFFILALLCLMAGTFITSTRWFSPSVRCAMRRPIRGSWIWALHPKFAAAIRFEGLYVRDPFATLAIVLRYDHPQTHLP